MYGSLSLAVAWIAASGYKRLIKRYSRQSIPGKLYTVTREEGNRSIFMITQMLTGTSATKTSFNPCETL